MRTLFFILLFLTTTTLQAQTLQADFETGKALMREKKVKEALPYFKRILASNDEPLKRTMINSATETWLDRGGTLDFSVVKEFLMMLNTYLGPLLSVKPSEMSANDQYTVGLIFWSYAYSGMDTETPKAVVLLNASYQKGNKQALKYLPDAFAKLKRSDASVLWNDVIQIHGIAASELNTIKPLTKLGWDNYSDLGTFSKLSQAKKDTARDVVLASLGVAAQVLPDSFYRVVDYFWLRTYNTLGRQDTALTGLLNYFFSTTNGSEVPQARKGFAWHYLYKYFYENLPRNEVMRKEYMTKLKALYPNDESALLLVISEFLKENRSNILGLILSADAKWLNTFVPSTISFPNDFFYAASSTGQDFVPFLDKNPNVSVYSSSIVSGFRNRFNIFFNIVNDDKEQIKITTAVVRIATDGSSELISKLLVRNDLKNISSLKHIQADMQILNNLASYKKDLQLPMFFDELPSVFKNWSAADKSSYDSQYLDLLIETVQKNVNTSKSNNWMAEAGGKNTLDFKDYDKAQKTLDKLKTIL